MFPGFFRVFIIAIFSTGVELDNKDGRLRQLFNLLLFMKTKSRSQYISFIMYIILKSFDKVLTIVFEIIMIKNDSSDVDSIFESSTIQSKIHHWEQKNVS